MQDYKRFEMYLGWTCNHKCIFCVEFPTMDKMWNRVISNGEVLKKLITYKKRGYNHVTYLWWEPFIQKNFEFALKAGKKLWFHILVTTNGSMMQFEKLAEKFLPYIDELIISIPAIDKELQPIINDTKGIIDFDKVFENIRKYWRGNLLKTNTVLNPLNLEKIDGIVKFLVANKVHEFSFTYPDIQFEYYGKDHVRDKIALKYSDVIEAIKEPFSYALDHGIAPKIVDVPLCMFPDSSWDKYSDDAGYQARTKLMANETEHNRLSTGVGKSEKPVEIHQDQDQREQECPRMRRYEPICKGCTKMWVCWGISDHYSELFGLDEIKPFLKK